MRLPKDFFTRDVLEVAPELIGMKLVRMMGGERRDYTISEVEAYRGTDDLACHASKGRTKRTEVMFHEGGKLYIYIIYGMYYMLNIVTGPLDHPQAVLIRGLTGLEGPGRLTRELKIDQGFYGEPMYASDRIWIEKGVENSLLLNTPRIGVDYAGEYWSGKLWRWKVNAGPR